MRFIAPRHLANHQAVHTKDHPHKCHLCAARFKLRDGLSHHYIKQHVISIKDVEERTKTANTAKKQQIPGGWRVLRQ